MVSVPHNISHNDSLARYSHHRDFRVQELKRKESATTSHILSPERLASLTGTSKSNVMPVAVLELRPDATTGPRRPSADALPAPAAASTPELCKEN
jgi:hypothetical protein